MSLSVDIVKKLRDITLKIVFTTESADGVTGILGASGCGKSMTLKCIAGIETPDWGRIVLNGRVLFDSERQINRKVQERRTGYLFQNYALFPHMTVLKNVEIALQHSFSETGEKKKEEALSYLRMFHVEELMGHYPGRLSGGQQQRVALARIMASRPDVLMLDEPFSALDYYLKESLQLELMEELTGYDGDVLLVTHSRDEIYRLCSRIHVLEKGRLVVSGEVKDVFHDPKVVSAAKLTGCKNIVKAEFRSIHMLYVPQWDRNMIIKERCIPEDIQYIGVRAHDLERVEDVPGEVQGKLPVDSEQSEELDRQNLLPCRLRQILDDPFEVTLILENGIWWKIPKELWKHTFHEHVPAWMRLPEDSIFFLREDD